MKNPQINFKKILLIFGITLINMQSINAIQEGKDYIELETPIPNAENTLIEIYNYTCPFCFHYSKILPEVIKILPKNITFEPYHLSQMGHYGKQASEIFAVSISKDKKNRVDINSDKSSFKKVLNTYFEEYHVKKNQSLNNVEGFLKVGLNSINMSIKDFNKQLESNDVQNILKKWEISYNVARIQGIPAFIVNGKYLIYTKSITSIQDLQSKILELLKK